MVVNNNFNEIVCFNENLLLIYLCIYTFLLSSLFLLCCNHYKLIGYCLSHLLTYYHNEKQLYHIAGPPNITP